jgi:hypothetical protein
MAIMKKKKKKTTNVSEDMGQKELLHTTGSNVS